jgi:hypothetical protein
MGINLHSILMVRPSKFRRNLQTVESNYFQNDTLDLNSDTISKNAIKEFDELVLKIKSCGFKVFVFQDDGNNDTPDSIYPNNWITFHNDKRIAIYPMYAKNRRLERNENVLNFLEHNNVYFNHIFDYSSAEKKQMFLEGTGSMVLDRINKKAYCSISKRTNEDLIFEFCNDFKYLPIIFNSFQNHENKRKPIYHTNVMMSVAKDYVIVCLEAIDDKNERKKLISSFEDDKKEIISISENQLKLFVGNVIELRKNEKSFLFMSDTAHRSLKNNQLQRLTNYSKIISSPIDTIEKCGGGGVRCMIAEIFN